MFNFNQINNTKQKEELDYVFKEFENYKKPK